MQSSEKDGTVEQLGRTQEKCCRGCGGGVIVGTSGGMTLQSLPSAHPSALPPQVTADGVEVVQVVQDLNHTVPLVADKRTLVRVYLSVGGAASVMVRGTLAARRAGSGGWTLIPAAAKVLLNPADTGPGGLRRKRETLALSLNFLLPPALLAPGDVQVELANLETVQPVAPIQVPAGTNRQVTFLRAVPLRVHVIGVRYEVTAADGSTHSYEPSPLDFALTQSWLGRAYPVAQVDWSQTVVDWPGAPPWPTDENALGTWGKDYVNAYISALRGQDVSHGIDHRTHYFGLAADGGGFMRGWAANIPATPDPSVVASGPAGPPVGTFAWDTDGSYADWYTGHELAHTFGRAHPGFCAGNSHDDPAFPYPNGQISDNNGTYVGYEAGDFNHAITPSALPGAMWHDLMTYCDYQWLSRYTYSAIYSRLIAEDALPGAPGPPPAPPPGAPPGAAPSPGVPAWGPPGAPMGTTLSSAAIATGPVMPAQPSGIHVVVRLNQTKGEGNFRFVTPVPSAAVPTQQQAQPALSGYVIRVKRSSGSDLDYPAEFRRDACGDATDTDVTGSLDTVIPNDPTAVALELLYDNSVLDTYRAGPEPPQPVNVRPAAAGGRQLAGVSSFASMSPRPKIVWDLSGAIVPSARLAAQTGTAPVAIPAGAGLLYTVQVSTDDGHSWRTLGVGLTAPEVSLDPHLFAGTETIQVRVIATNGFRTKTATQTLSVNDL